MGIVRMPSKRRWEIRDGVNVNSHFGYNHYHSLKVGMSYLSEEDLSQIFKELSWCGENKGLTKLAVLSLFFF